MGSDGSEIWLSSRRSEEECPTCIFVAEDTYFKFEQARKRVEEVKSAVEVILTLSCGVPFVSKVDQAGFDCLFDRNIKIWPAKGFVGESLGIGLVEGLRSETERGHSEKFLFEKSELDK